MNNLRAGDVFLMRSRGGQYSLAGTYICADEPIAVFTGGQYAEVPAKSDPKNHLYAQVVSTDKLGKEFVVPSSKGMKFDYVRFTAVENNTEIRKNGRLLAVLNARETYQDTLFNPNKNNPSSAYYTTSDLVATYLYQTSRFVNCDTIGWDEEGEPELGRYSRFGAPALTPITPIEYGMHNVIFATLDAPNIQKHYVNIVVHKDGVDDLLYDGMGIRNKFSVCEGNTDYYFAQIEIDNTQKKAHLIMCEKATFVANVYGFGVNGSRYESYAYSAGSLIVHPAWMLIDNERIKEKTICVTDEVDFESVIQYDYASVSWQFKHEGKKYDFYQDDVMQYQFSDIEEWEINLIVHQKTPMCDYDVGDTIKAIINVKDTFRIAPTLENGNYRIVCESNRSETIVQGNTYQYQTDTMKINGVYFYRDTLQSVAGCDSICDIKVLIAPEYDVKLDTAVCENHLPYIWNATDHLGKYQINIERKDFPATTELPYTKSYRKMLETVYGCDSLVTLNITLYPVARDTVRSLICDNEQPYKWIDGQDRFVRLMDNYAPGRYVFNDTLRTTDDCDDIRVLELEVSETFYDSISVRICKGDAFLWKETDKTEGFNHVTNHWVDTLITTEGIYKRYLSTDDGCDDIRVCHVLIGETYDVHLYDTICESSLPWSYRGVDSHSDVVEWSYPSVALSGLPSDSVYSYTFSTLSPFVCDSVVHYHLHVLPTMMQDTVVAWCASAGPFRLHDGTKSWSSSGDYIDTLSVVNVYGCDSVVRLHLDVLPTIITRIDTMICDNEVPYNHNNILTTNLHDLTATGVYRDTLQTVLGCDSVIELHLTVSKTYHVYDIQEICDNEVYIFNDSVFEGGAGYYTYDTLLHTVWGCDSLVTLQLQIHPTYRFEQVITVCQDTINSYEWFDDKGGIHPQIDISKPGDFTFYDTLYTIHGCDSIFGLRLHVAPIYRYDSVYVACDNEQITWQGRVYNGKRLEPVQGIASGVYYDTAYYKTQEGCDSIYYLKYTFYPTYDTTIYASVCYDGTDGLPYYWETYDNYTEEQYIDTISIDEFDNRESEKEFVKLLHTKEGCDSLVHLYLGVHPTYYFITDTIICSNEFVDWHGKRYRKQGVYYERLQTETFGCDSIYELRLRVKPAYLIELYAGKRCDNSYYVMPDEETGMWQDTIFFRKDTLNYRFDELREETYTRTFYTDEGCDSVYQMHVTICPTYFVDEQADTICSDELYEWHGQIYNLQPGLHKLDTAFTTVYGCDSAFYKEVYVRRHYHFYQSDSICQDEELHWQGRTLKDLSPGIHQFDTAYLTFDNCDSIYTEYLTVFPVYHSETHDVICDNDIYVWQGRTISHSEGLYHYDTIYTSIHGCDSVFTLDLRVYPTTQEIRYDTICAGEQYVLPNKQVDKAGYYVDTTSNEYGCDHYIHLYLEVVPPTRVAVKVDTVCADEKAFEITYSYEGTFPVEYSVYFSELGHYQGFEDIIHAPVSDLTDSVIVIEIPHGDILPMPNEQYYDGVTHQFTTEPKYQYVEPNIYPITVYLHNGICSDDTLACDHVDALIQYPHWIHEQHWNDAIVIYKDTFNGGYEFSSYQWYENGVPLEGEIGEYLYLPHNLKKDTYYQVALTRKTDGLTFLTCPITPAFNVDSIVPRLHYFSVVPTLVYMSHPYVSILCNIGGYYEVYNSTGIRVQASKRFEPQYDASVLIDNPELPANVMKDDIYLNLEEGLYIIKLTADNGEQRRIKIIVTHERH